MSSVDGKWEVKGRLPLDQATGGLLAVCALLISAAVPTIPVLLLAVFVSVLLISLNDLTNRRRPGRQARSREHRLLLEGVHHYPMPYALYDEEDRLVVWNDAYEKIYARTFARLSNALDARQLHYADLVRDNASETLEGAELDSYVKKRVAEQRSSCVGVFDREYPGFGWYRVSKHITPSGGVAGYAIDINELKQREAELMLEIERRKQLEEDMRKIANTDELTGIANRRHFIACATEAFSGAVDDNAAVCLLVLDVDHFKRVNDTFGHAAGDEVLRRMAESINRAVRDGQQLLGRLGGEEFGVLLPHCSLDAGFEVADWICQATRKLSFVAGRQAFTVSISVGVAERRPADRNVAELLKRADEALYIAKANGRDRAEVAPAISSPFSEPGMIENHLERRTGSR